MNLKTLLVFTTEWRRDSGVRQTTRCAASRPNSMRATTSCSCLCWQRHRCKIYEFKKQDASIGRALSQPAVHRSRQLYVERAVVVRVADGRQEHRQGDSLIFNVGDAQLQSTVMLLLHNRVDKDSPSDLWVCPEEAMDV